MKVCILDPGLSRHTGALSENLGDLIIQDAVKREVAALFPGAAVTHLSTKEPLWINQLRQINECERVLVGGTNLLSSHILSYRQWKVSPLDAWLMRRAILLGVGWWQYQDDADLITRLTLRGVLSKRGRHSVRDGYTAKMLGQAGAPNVINTGCVTMWPFAGMDQEAIAQTKGRNALVMLTDYMREPELDKRLVTLLGQRYEKVYLWEQGRSDAEYVASLGLRVNLLEHNFETFRNFVSNEPSFDYIGTRLHGGVWCLLNRRRSLILEVDNRAAEIHKDTNLPTCKRDDFDFMERWMTGPTATKIQMNEAAIHEWRSQFARC